MGMMMHRHKKRKQRVVEQATPVIEKVVEEKVVTNKNYTKSEIARMSTSELQSLANDVGIEKALETSGAELKKKLVEHFGL